MTKPLIYIASLRRTGSTVLSEALTSLPHSFIFREPYLSGGEFRVQDEDATTFLQKRSSNMPDGARRS